METLHLTPEQLLFCIFSCFSNIFFLTRHKKRSFFFGLRMERHRNDNFVIGAEKDFFRKPFHSQ